jgi:hypothetical protein
VPAVPLRRTLYGLSIALNVAGAAAVVWKLAHRQTRSESFQLDRRSQLEALRGRRAEVVMLGDSLTNFGEWGELLDRPGAANRGIGMDTTEDVLARLSPRRPITPRAWPRSSARSAGALTRRANALIKGAPVAL